MQDNTAHQKNKYLAGSAIHEYLTDYAKRFNIYPRIRFGTCVSEARRDDEVGGWALKTTNSSGTEVLRCRKLVIATGPTSNPFIPRIPSAESHSYPIIHSSQLPQYSDSPSFMGTISRVTVVGGAKSSFDSVYAFMKEGKHVDWVIRPDGSGPASIYPPTIFGIKTINISCTRLFSAFSPNLYGLFEHDWCYRFLHRSIIGALLVSHFWIIVTWMCNWHAGYRRSQNAEKLRPSPNR
jgi:dimethylaniline monooxygenase (N-oxide forming)